MTFQPKLPSHGIFSKSYSIGGVGGGGGGGPGSLGANNPFFYKMCPFS